MSVGGQETTPHTTTRRFGARARWLVVALLAAQLCACMASAPRSAYPKQVGGTAVTKRFAGALMSEVIELAHGMGYAESCADVCRLTTRICEAADKICEIAASDAADRELADRCGHARTHCVVARERCRECG